MVFIKGSYIYDVGKKVENSDNIFVFANADNIYNCNKYNKTDMKAKQTLPKPNFAIYYYVSSVPIVKLNWKKS